MDEFHAISLCVVVRELTPNQPNLLRIADYDKTMDIFRPFIVRESFPKYYENRDRLYAHDGPLQIGAIGVWEWEAVPNRNDPVSDYIYANYRLDLIPAEMHPLASGDIINEFRSLLQNGISELDEYIGHLFYKKDGKKLKAIFCNRDSWVKKERLYKLKSDIYTLPIYELERCDFNIYDIYDLKRKWMVYNHIAFKAPISQLPVKSHTKVVQSVLLEYAKNIHLMKLGVLSRNERQNVRNFLNNARAQDIFQEIAEKCGCTPGKAELYVKEFIEQAELILDRHDTSTKVLEALITANTDISQKFKQLAEAVWEEENKDKIQKADQEIQQKKEELSKIQAELSSLKNQVAEANQKIADLKRQAEKEQSIGEHALEVIRQRLEEARNDAGAFIAQYILYNPLPAMDLSAATISQEEQLYLSGQVLKDGLEEAEDYAKLIDFLCDELREAGIGEKHMTVLAAYLCALSDEQIPVLLAGPCAAEIADAYSAALFGRTAGRLICRGDYCDNAIQDAVNSEDPVIMIENPWNGRWIDFLCNRLYAIKKAVFITVPYTEDLVMEPASLYHYMLPLFTEYFAEGIPGCNWQGSHKSSNFKSCESKSQRSHSITEICRSLPVSGFCFNRLCSVLTDAVNMLDDNEDKKLLPYYCALLPFAVVLGKQKNLVDRIRDDVDLTKEEKSEFLRWIGEEEE